MTFVYAFFGAFLGAMLSRKWRERRKRPVRKPYFRLADHTMEKIRRQIKEIELAEKENRQPNCLRCGEPGDAFGNCYPCDHKDQNP